MRSRAIVRNPFRRTLDAVGPWWNWKCALLSSALRGAIFFSANLTAGAAAARTALLNDLLFRGLLAGTFGALIQRLSTMRRRRLANAITLVGLPVATHLIEAIVHWRAGTARLGLSVVLSVATTVTTTAFDLFAMRRRTFIVGRDSQSLGRDLLHMPRLIAAFLAVPLTAARARRSAR
jgi:hypothetical protein